MDTYTQNFWCDGVNKVKGVSLTFIDKKEHDKFVKLYEIGKVQITFQVDKL